MGPEKKEGVSRLGQKLARLGFVGSFFFFETSLSKKRRLGQEKKVGLPTKKLAVFFFGNIFSKKSTQKLGVS